MSQDNRPNDDRKPAGWIQVSWMRQYALVFQFLATVGVLGYLGMRLDERYGWQSWGLLGGLLLGVAAGLYPMLKEGLRQNRNERR